jgi:hypothetical protein
LVISRYGSATEQTEFEPQRISTATPKPIPSTPTPKPDNNTDKNSYNKIYVDKDINIMSKQMLIKKPDMTGRAIQNMTVFLV